MLTWQSYVPPLNPTPRISGRRSCRAVFRTRQSQKTSLYSDLVAKEGASFHAFVLSSCGGFSSYAKALIRSIASYAADHHPLFDYRTFYGWAVAQVAGALQEGNRAVDTKGVAVQH